MKKGMIGFLVLLLFVIFSAGCGSKAGEKEYFDLAYQYMGKEKWSDAEMDFQKILDEYPNGVYSSKALFMIGFINANYLQNEEKARKYYTEFLEKYPNHDLADDAKYELDNLGKNIDDLPFLRDNKASADSLSSGSPKKVSASVK